MSCDPFLWHRCKRQHYRGENRSGVERDWGWWPGWSQDNFLVWRNCSIFGWWRWSRDGGFVGTCWVMHYSKGCFPLGVNCTLVFQCENEEQTQEWVRLRWPAASRLGVSPSAWKRSRVNEAPTGCQLSPQSGPRRRPAQGRLICTWASITNTSSLGPTLWVPAEGRVIANLERSNGKAKRVSHHCESDLGHPPRAVLGALGRLQRRLQGLTQNPMEDHGLLMLTGSFIPHVLDENLLSTQEGHSPCTAKKTKWRPGYTAMKINPHANNSNYSFANASHNSQRFSPPSRLVVSPFQWGCNQEMMTQCDPKHRGLGSSG